MFQRWQKEHVCFLTMVKIPFHDIQVIGRCHMSICSIHMLKYVVFSLYFFSDMIEKHALLCFFLYISIFCCRLWGIFPFLWHALWSAVLVLFGWYISLSSWGWGWKDAAFKTRISSQVYWVITEITWDFVVPFTWPIPSNRVSFLCSGSCI